MSQILNNKMLLDESALARNEGEEERAWRERVAFHAARWTRESYEAVCNFMNDLLVTRYHENHEVNHEVLDELWALACDLKITYHRMVEVLL